jgi:hypothetical protein
LCVHQTEVLIPYVEYSFYSFPAQLLVAELSVLVINQKSLIIRATQEKEDKSFIDEFKGAISLIISL